MDGDIVETGINWDHETGEIVISTRRRAVESKLRRLGLVPTTNEGPNGYVTFRTTQDCLRVRFCGPPSEKRRKAGKERALKLHEYRSQK